MKTLFDQTQCSTMKMKNRFVRSATHDGRADKLGHVTQELINRYEELAKGGVGTIITGLVNVTDIEKIVPGQMAIYDDSFIQEYRAFTDAVHRHDANIIAQLVCNGSQNSSTSEGVLWAPSEIEGEKTVAGSTEMTLEDINVMKKAFVNGALRAKAAGFDGVQVHAAHGYLLSRFLTPYYNRRSDEYGGNAENRARALVEICRDIRQAVGADYPVWVKINCDDFMEQGFGFEECKQVCKALEGAGLTAIEVSGGSRLAKRNEGTIRRINSDAESYFLKYAAELAQEVEIPVILVGGNRNFDKLEAIVNDTKIEYISMSRPLIREPGLISRWASGDKEPARCVSCTNCFGAVTQCIFSN